MKPRKQMQNRRLGLPLVVNAPCGVCCVLVLAVLFQVRVAAQACQPERLQSKMAGFERELESREGAVRLHRVEELEDDLFVPRQGSSSIEGPFFLFQVEQRRFFLREGKIVQQVPAGAFFQYVAISKDGERTYRLAGFAESDDDFRRLVYDYQLLPPHNRGEAESRALFCAQVVFGVGPKQWISDEMQARVLLGNHSLDPSAKDAFRQADRRWQSFRNKYRKTNMNLTTTGNADGTFLTRLPLFWAPVENETPPEIRELRIQVNRDGSCHKLSD